MIFLFNSSSRSTYLDNIFATMHLPLGAINRYQYRYEGNNSAVDSSIKMNCNVGDNVIISYIDKYAAEEEVVYLPLRKGRIIKYEMMDGRVYYDVKLLEYCHATNEKRYSNFIITEVDQVYHQESNGTWSGILATKKDVDVSNLLETTDDSWFITAKRLSQKKLFQDYYSIFTKLSITNVKNDHLEIQKVGNEYGYLLKSKERYTIKLSFYIHGFHDLPMTKIHMRIADSQGICNIASRELELGNKQSIFDMPLQVLWSDKVQRTTIGIIFHEDSVGTKQIKYAVKPLDLFVISRINPRLRVALISACVFMLGLSTWISSLPIESIIGDAECIIKSGEMLGVFQSMLYKFCLLLKNCRYFYNVICSGVTALSTFCLIALYGKPKL